MNFYRRHFTEIVEWWKVTYRSDWDDISFSFDLKLSTGVTPVGAFRLDEAEVPIVEEWLRGGRLFFETAQMTVLPGVEHRLFWIIPPQGAW